MTRSQWTETLVAGAVILLAAALLCLFPTR